MIFFVLQEVELDTSLLQETTTQGKKKLLTSEENPYRAVIM